MTLVDYYDRQIPEYYPTMYLDGYTPAQILHAVHRKMIREYMEREAEKEAERKIEKKVKKQIDSAMNDLFKDWK